jgi:hypothetical protein
MTTSIDQAKAEAAVLSDFLATLGKKLKHTHALEAIARLKGFNSWTEFKVQAAEAGAPPAQTLVDTLLAQDVEELMLSGVPHSIRQCDQDVLRVCQQILLSKKQGDPAPCDTDLNAKAVRIRCEDDSAQGIPFLRWLTVEELLYARPRGMGWVLGGKGEFVLLVAHMAGKDKAVSYPQVETAMSA